MNQAYLDYLEKTLGVKELLWPFSSESISPESQPVADQQTGKVTILFIGEKTWSPRAAQLFEKMREAMKVSASQVKIVFANETSEPDLQIEALSADRVVCFSENLFEMISVDPTVKFRTFDPELLLKDPSLKKDTWLELQKVMKSLNLI